MRANLAQHDYRALCKCPKIHVQYWQRCKIAVQHDFCNFKPFFIVNSQNPPIKIVRKFLHLLDQSSVDFEEELGKEAVIVVMISIAFKLPSFGIGLGDMSIF